MPAEQLDLFHDIPQRPETTRPLAIAPREPSAVAPRIDRAATSRTVTRRFDHVSIANELHQEARGQRVLAERGEEIVRSAYL